MTVPLWALALMLVPDPGFLIYLGVQNAYYGVAQRVFGATLFPTEGSAPSRAAPAGLRSAHCFMA